MLYAYYGKDIETARKKVQATVSNLLTKNPDALYFRITADTLNEYDFNELTESQSLFKNEYVVLLDTVLSVKETSDEVLNNLDKIANSKHLFFILDTKLTAPIVKKLKDFAIKVVEFEEKNNKKKESFNTFSLTDALGEKNIKKLWTLFREAKYNGVSDEEIHGVLFWMFKSLSLASQSKSPEEAGMKTYPFGKAKKFLENYQSPQKLNKLIAEFALLPQYSRRNGVSLEINLEKFILTLKDS